MYRPTDCCNTDEINLPSQGRLESSNQILVYVPIKLM